MIASKSQFRDMHFYVEFLKDTEYFVRLYQRHPNNEDLKSLVATLYEYLEKLKNRIETYDYTEEDKREQILDDLLDDFQRGIYYLRPKND